MSNFGGKALAKLGANRAMTTFGAYDMAGNVKEWAINPLGTLKYSMGGAWDESPYIFSLADARDPFSRTISLGFRCVKRPTPPPPQSFAELQIPVRKAPTEKPVDDKTYRIFSDLHQYQPSPLDARVERAADSSPYWTRETVSFRAAYGNDRVVAHLFLPRNVEKPYQVVVVFGGSTIMQIKRVEDFDYPYEFLIRSGRAVLIPVYWGTLERGPSQMFGLPANEDRDRSLKWY